MEVGKRETVEREWGWICDLVEIGQGVDIHLLFVVENRAVVEDCVAVGTGRNLKKVHIDLKQGFLH